MRGRGKLPAERSIHSAIHTRSLEHFTHMCTMPGGRRHGQRSQQGSIRDLVMQPYTDKSEEGRRAGGRLTQTRRILGLQLHSAARCIVVRGDAWPVLLSPCNTQPRPY